MCWAAWEYLRYTGAGENRPEYMQTLVDHAARVLAYLHTQAQIDCRLLALAGFYYPIAPGAKAFGRVAASLDLSVGYQAGCQLRRALGHGFLAAEHAAGGPG